MKIKENVSLKKYLTFKIGGKAKYFLIAKNKNQILNGILWAKKKKLPFFILGGGSNVLFSDKGYEGLVVKLQNTHYKIRNTKIVAEAGVPLQKLVIESAKKGLSGLENLAGIPGTLGGAIYQNAGAFGREIKDLVEEVEILKIENCKLKIEKLKIKIANFLIEIVFSRERKIG